MKKYLLLFFVYILFFYSLSAQIVKDSLVSNVSIKAYTYEIKRLGFYYHSEPVTKQNCTGFAGPLKEYLAKMYDIDSVRVIMDSNIKLKSIVAHVTNSPAYRNYLETTLGIISSDTMIRTNVWILKKNDNFQDSIYKYDDSIFGGTVGQFNGEIDFSNISIYFIRRFLEEHLGIIVINESTSNDLYFNFKVPFTLFKQSKIQELNEFFSKGMGHRFFLQSELVRFKHFKYRIQ